MRIAIFSDVHGNLEALQAVMRHCDTCQVDRVVYLGDLVGYGPDPSRCIEAIRDVAELVLIGNHDHAVVSPSESRNFNPVAKAAIRWTSDILQEVHVEYLRGLHLVVDEDDAVYVHASPKGPETWPYLYSLEEGRRDLAYTDARVCFVGHSHHAFVCNDEREEILGEGKITISGSARYLTNVGSVGQPRDGEPRAAFALWDQALGEIKIHRVAYAVESTQQKIRKAQLPEYLAERLATGR